MSGTTTRAVMLPRVEHPRGGHRGGRDQALRCVTRWTSHRRPPNHIDATRDLWTHAHPVWMTSTLVRCENVSCPQSTGPTTSYTFETSLHEEKSRL